MFMKKTIRGILLGFACTILIFSCTENRRERKYDENLLSAIQLPSSQNANLYLFKSWKFEKPVPLKASFLYISGGIDNIDKGSPDWGSTDSRKFRMIGDYAGELRVLYENSIVDTIPLVYGYTIWFKHGWTEGKEPFVSDQRAKGILDSTLFLNQIYDGKKDYVLRIRLRNAAVTRIDYYDNLLKDGTAKLHNFQVEGTGTRQPVPDSIEFIAEDKKDSGFYASRTVDSINTYPVFVKQNLKRLMHLLYYFDFDHENVTEVDIPKNYHGPSILFSGGSEANIISSVFHHNLGDQASRVDTSGLVHESAYRAPSWFYDGFGTWTDSIGIGEVKKGSYYECYYTRNKTIMILPDLDYIEESNRALALLDRQLMYFPENFPVLQLGGKKIPGHWTVIANQPLIYSHVLTGVGWPTRYTKEKFGSHYRDFGNPETDGHGHAMMSHWKTWHNSGRDKKWVRDRWNYLKEAADYIVWSLDNPDLSFSNFGLLYAESEAAMNDYSLYCNFPCYLGLLMYAEMADSIGEKEYSVKWKTTADKLKDSMAAYFGADDAEYGIIWRKVGFYHENILMTLKEYEGFDLSGKLPDEWMKRSLHTYMKERDLNPDYYGPTGLGYDHGVITQTAMMLDRIDEVTKWMRNLAHICYAPRLPKPYIVPECASIDVKRGIIRRQGDIGNGYQQAEIVNTILLCAGVDDNVPGILKIMPRLPEKWSMKISGYPVVVYSNGMSHTSKIEMSISCPENDEQILELKAISGGDLKNVNFRLGPFNAGTKSIKIMINGGKKKDYSCFDSGDRAWVWVKIDDIKPGSQTVIKTQK
jgi:hypothetical protein